MHLVNSLLANLRISAHDSSTTLLSCPHLDSFKLKDSMRLEFDSRSEYLSSCSRIKHHYQLFSGSCRSLDDPAPANSPTYHTFLTPVFLLSLRQVTISALCCRVTISISSSLPRVHTASGMEHWGLKPCGNLDEAAFKRPTFPTS